MIIDQMKALQGQVPHVDTSCFLLCRIVLCCLLLNSVFVRAQDAQPPEVATLSAEVRTKGWIVFSALSEHGDWDLSLMRPDGSQCRALTRTQEWSEFAPQFSRDGNLLFYRRLNCDEAISGNHYGEQGVPVVSKSDGTEPRVVGKIGDLPWASWSPDGSEFATLSIKGIAFVDAVNDE